MRTQRWKKLLLSLGSGSFLFQIAGCTEAAIGATTVFTGITAGGMIFLLNRILRD
ncbi:MAG: hypothetical protein CHACPFDD_01986 [Phycisphaerae bacterium]|nr:hypothetical protein [Phycisphaerae bacterium]